MTAPKSVRYSFVPTSSDVVMIATKVAVDAIAHDAKAVSIAHDGCGSSA
ncbi:hypothetical protein [Bradyrhizobium sp. CCBAU 51745]|nr:hypothetical protein [Bradyrhizobium sp. CCBAU 51745]